MRFPGALPAERRAAVIGLLRDTDLTLVAIGDRTGVSAKTVATWNARAGWPRPPRLRRGKDPSRWDPGRLAAVARLCGEPRNDPADIAEAAGVGRGGAEGLLLACGKVPRPAQAWPAPLDAESAADAPTLRAHLRAHIARQIAAFDAALKGEGAAVIDSARVLRDLGGLKRLFDEVTAVAGPGAGGAGSTGDGRDGGSGPEPDLPALRAEIARRYARFVGGRNAA